MIYTIMAEHPGHATLSSSGARRVAINYGDVVQYQILNKTDAILKPAKFTANSHIRILRARLDTPGAAGLRAGFLDGFQNAARITTKVLGLNGTFGRFYSDILRFNEFVTVDTLLTVNGDETEPLSFESEFWAWNYDALGIADEYKGAIFSLRSILEIETSGVPVNE